MSNALYSVFNLEINDETAGFKDFAVLLANSLNSFDLRLRTSQRGSDVIKNQRTYDVFIGTVTGVGTLDASINHVTLEADNTNVDQIYDDLFVPRRGTLSAFGVNVFEDANGKTKLDIGLVTAGTLGGQPASTILIRKFDQEPTASEVNNVIAAIANAGSFQGMAVRPIYNKNNKVIRYVLVLAYEAA